MCGISGYLETAGRDCDHRSRLAAMSSPLRHRGPDDSGIWFDAEAGIGLAHRRLAILDLSPQGRQPMVSPQGRHVISYNGEVYNFLELGRELGSLGHVFRGGSDTEVLLAAIEQWGIAQALSKFKGMFAFALWDRQERVLTLARDRIGEKPLYYAVTGGAFLFGSELKALRGHPAWRGGIDPEALQALFRYTYIPAPHTIHPDVRKLEPGTFLQVHNREGCLRQSSHTYWSVVDAAIRGGRKRGSGSETEVSDELEKLLSGVLQRQMLADVPLGAFLSGGVDSSAIVALMQAQSSRKIKTFCIGFHEQRFNEAPYAKSVARHLGTEHTEFYLTEQDALDLVPELPAIYDEPFADSSQIPTCLLTRLARGSVTVALSGDGGDELFFGYDRYRMVQSFWQKLSLAPKPLRQALSALLRRQSRLLEAAPIRAVSAGGHRLTRFAELFASETMHSLNEKMTGYDSWAEDLVAFDSPARSDFTRGLWDRFPDGPMHMMLLDLLRYLPDDILVKVDRAAMASSLETRVPFLDHSLIEYLFRLPFGMKYRGGSTKHLLREVLYRHVPKELIERPKMGFGVPIEIWLRGPLRDWGESLLSERALSESGLLNPAPIRRKWLEHQSGQCNWRYRLWPVLMFQSWLQAHR